MSLVLNTDELKKLINGWFATQQTIPVDVTVTIVCNFTNKPQIEIVSSDPDSKLVSEIITYENFLALGWSKSHAKTIIRDIKHGVEKNIHENWETLTVTDFLAAFRYLPGVGPKALETVSQLLKQAGIIHLPRTLTL